MKKMISMLLALVMVLSLAACGANNAPAATEAPTEAAKHVDGTMEELVNKIIEIQPVEFMGMTMPVDLADVDAVKYFTGLDSAEGVKEAAVFEPMIGSIAFSMVAVQVEEGADAAAVAEAMKSGIDTRKWICVEANDLMVVNAGNVVLLVMVDSNNGLTAQSFVDAFLSIVVE